MKDPIERQDAIDAIYALSNYTIAWLESAVDEIEALPSAQSEIIRCKDCKYVRKWRSEESAKQFGQIYECARGVFRCPNSEDFCSYAERREE